VPVIVGSPGFADSGLLIVTWDEANITPGSSTACCGEPVGPNTLAPGVLGQGGGRTGSVLISPFIAPGSKNPTPYNHYSLLRSIEDLFGFPHLGYAAQEGLKPFGDDVFNATAPQAPPTPNPVCRPARDGPAVEGMRLRGRLLSFFARRSGRAAVRAALRGGERRLMASPRRLVGCRLYQLKLPRGVRWAAVRARGQTVRVRRGPSGEDPT
jgi:hypothetical protein